MELISANIRTLFRGPVNITQQGHENFQECLISKDAYYDRQQQKNVLFFEQAVQYFIVESIMISEYCELKLKRCGQLNYLQQIAKELMKLLYLLGVLKLIQVCVLSQGANSELTLYMNTTNNNNESMVIKGNSDSRFLYDQWNCSMVLYFYDNEKQKSDSYSLYLSDLSHSANVNLSTDPNISLIADTKRQCLVGKLCKIDIVNNCSQTINNFYRVNINITGFDDILSYYVVCNWQGQIFQWSSLVAMIVEMALTILIALDSRTWSFGGWAIDFNIWWLLAYLVIFTPLKSTVFWKNDNTINVAIVFWKIAAVGIGFFGVFACVNELLFLIKVNCLKRVLFHGETFKFRVRQLLSLIVGMGVIGVMISWYFIPNSFWNFLPLHEKDWLMICFTDLIAVCVVIGSIKFLKIRSLRIVVLTLLGNEAVNFIMSMILAYGQHQHCFFEQKLLQESTNPLFFYFLNFLTKGSVNQNCVGEFAFSWSFSGMLLSYLHRFDISRQAKLYFKIGIISVFIRETIWIIIITLPTSFQIQPRFVTDPCMFVIICMFAYKRQELSVLWNGRFYDYEIGNEEELLVVREKVRSDLPERLRISGGSRFVHEMAEMASSSSDNQRQNAI